MASSVFYRFKHQKDLSRITFDGTGISVFELKRDIITHNKLGEGTDFELNLLNEEADNYDDDTTIIPRSTTVIAKRSPARQMGRGGAARYVSGRMPVSALSGKKAIGKVGGASSSLQTEAQTEEEKLSAIFQSGTQEWAKKQEELQSTMPLRRPPNKADIPDKPPPPGYVCYRCGEKGHWIQACPTNDDPNYVSQPRFKRTTGIPKSMLVKVDKSDFDDEEERPAGLMLSADGDWVMAKSDYEEFRKYQAKVRQSKVAQQEEKQGSKELQERGLECPLDKRLFAEPMKTPCCAQTYCGRCISNALIENDLHCPHCKNDLLFDDLAPDQEKRAAVRAWEAERAERAKDNAAPSAATQQTPADTEASNTKSEDVPQPSIEPADRSGSKSPDPKKRKADLSLESNRAGSGPPPSMTQTPAATQQQAQQNAGANNNNAAAAMAAGFQNPMMWNMGNGQWPMNMPMMGMDMNAMNNAMNMQWAQQGQQGQQMQGAAMGVGGGQGQQMQQMQQQQMQQQQDANWQQQQQQQQQGMGNRGGRNAARGGRRR